MYLKFWCLSIEQQNCGPSDSTLDGTTRWKESRESSGRHWGFKLQGGGLLPRSREALPLLFWLVVASSSGLRSSVSMRGRVCHFKIYAFQITLVGIVRMSSSYPKGGMFDRQSAATLYYCVLELRKPKFALYKSEVKKNEISMHFIQRQLPLSAISIKHTSISSSPCCSILSRPSLLSHSHHDFFSFLRKNSKVLHNTHASSIQVLSALLFQVESKTTT
jgi:hypothetical protein